jgi:hypothetical protein
MGAVNQGVVRDLMQDTPDGFVPSVPPAQVQPLQNQNTNRVLFQDADLSDAVARATADLRLELQQLQARYTGALARQDKTISDLTQAMESKLAEFQSSSGERSFSRLVPPPDPESSSEEPVDIYGFKASEPGHTYHPRFAAAEDYTGTELSAKHKALRRDAVGQERLDRSDHLKRLPEHRDPSASKVMIGDVSIEGTSSKLGIADRTLWERYASSRVQKFSQLLVEAKGVYAGSQVFHGWYRVNARLLIGRYQFLSALIDYLTTVRYPVEEWPVIWRVLVRYVVLLFENRSFNKQLSFDRELVELVPDTGVHNAFPTPQMKFFAQERFNSDILLQVHSLLRTGVPDLDSAMPNSSGSLGSSGSTANTTDTSGAPKAGATFCKACGGQGHDLTKCTYPVRMACSSCSLPHISNKSSSRYTPCEVARKVARAGDGALRVLKSFRGGKFRWKDAEGKEEEWSSSSK